MKKSLIFVLFLAFMLGAAVFATARSSYNVIPDKCTGCKSCIPVCPVKAIDFDKGKATIDPEKCINCGLCVNSCAFNALKP